MAEPRRDPRWLPIAVVAVFLALAALAHMPQVLRFATDVVPRTPPRFVDLPADAAWSLLRMTVAYVASLAFAWAAGAWAATSPRAGRVILPLLDIAQSVPVLGFFPAAIYLFVRLLGGGRLSLELAACFLIFTSQVWNLAFGVYEGLRTIPSEIRAATDSLGVKGMLRWRTLLVPACVPTLLYNSILSWSNGWYFLIACEIIVVGSSQHDLPGLGSTLASAIAHGDLALAGAALAVLVAIVVALEVFVWRPLRHWSRHYRYDTAGPGEAEDAPFRLPDLGLPALVRGVRAGARALGARVPMARVHRAAAAAAGLAIAVWRWARWPALAALAALAALGVAAAARALAPPWPAESAELPLALALSFLRIAVAYVLALAWILPVTLWLSDRPRGLRALSLAAQIGASIPATAFFPVLVALLVGRLGGMEAISILLALTGMQWYLLFNVLAGVQRVPHDLRESLRALGLGRIAIWRTLVLPACMPSLVTGSVVAWGGAWNALILSEYVVYRDRVYQVPGLGSLLNRATFETGNRTMLLLSLSLLVATVVAFNRLVWARAYRHVHARYRMES